MLRSPHPVLLLVLVLVFAAGCKKKQKAPQAATPPPTITTPSEPAAQKPTPAIEVPLPEKPSATTTAKPTATRRTKPSPRKPAPKPAEPKPTENATVAKATPPRIVVQPGGSLTEPTPATVVPELSHTEEAHRRLTTEQLMQSTESNLKSLRRVLNEQERAMLQQIQLFLTQSREASQAQDLVRAHNLALKAHLLSDELVR